jgi:hypothetical protein
MIDLCSSGFAYDSCDAANLAFAIRCAKIDLGKALQDRGILTNITYTTMSGRDTGQLNPEYAGELAAAALNLGQQDLASARKADVERWVHAYQRGLPLLVRINAQIAEIQAERALAQIGA